MHIPDAYLSPATEAVAYGVMIPIWMIAARKTARNLSSKQAPLLAIGAAFCFAIQMFNIPAVGGTTAHALGASLLAILVGPWAAVLGMTLTLTIQALLFGDGGILSLGANCFDMAAVACFVGYGLHRLLRGNGPTTSTRSILSAGIAAYAATVAASFCAGVFLGIQPSIAHDSAGHALYCPFGLNVSVPAMVMSHLLVAGPAEAMITIASLAYLWRTFPEFGPASTRPKIGAGFRLARQMVWVLVLTPIGLIAGGSAFGEWDLGELKHMIGYEPAGIAKAHALVHPLLPDYGFKGLESGPWVVVGYLASALVGCGLVLLFALRMSESRRTIVESVIQAHGSPNQEMPSWLSHPNPPMPVAKRSKGSWLEKSLLKMRATVAKTIASEEVARAPGLLQSIDPMAKTIGFLCAIVATGLAQSLWTPIFFLCGVLVAARFSSVDLRAFSLRVAGSVAFFGLAVALPVTLESVTTGPTAFELLGISFSVTGIHSASLILFRLASGISLAMLWNLTTRWNLLLQSLWSLGVSRMFLATAALTYRYLFVVMETLAEMTEARTSRQVGACDKLQARTYAGNGTAILFAKSLAFTEEIHMAMVARSLPSSRGDRKNGGWSAADFGAVLAGVLCLAVIVLQGNHNAF